jgi:hypothetical protein
MKKSELTLVTVERTATPCKCLSLRRELPQGHTHEQDSEHACKFQQEELRKDEELLTITAEERTKK